jgi:hypothetical protein
MTQPPGAGIGPPVLCGSIADGASSARGLFLSPALSARLISLEAVGIEPRLAIPAGLELAQRVPGRVAPVSWTEPHPLGRHSRRRRGQGNFGDPLPNLDLVHIISGELPKLHS